MASSVPRPAPEPALADGRETRDLRRVDEVVLAAAALPAAEWTRFLRGLTWTDPDLLTRVQSRLERAAELPDTFLAIPAAELLTALTEAQEVEEAEPAAALPAGEERYERLERAGAGGMGEVYRAFDRQLQRPVALKLLGRAEPEARRRFLAEALAQARVRHDNVLEIYETGERAGQPFLAMRWVDGPTLLAIRGEISLEQKVRLLAQVAEGLHAAHGQGLIHRDVKPANILVEKTPDGVWKPWIADFGIAQEWRAEGEAAGPDAAGALAGTPPYMAPEGLAGRPADRRTDVYGLGATLYELLTGVPPFTAPDLLALLRQMREAAPVPPRAHLPSLPPALEAIVLNCLEKDPDRRYPSARALARDLERFLDGEVVEAHAATWAYRLTRLGLRHRRLLLVAGIGTVLLAAALTGAALLGLEARAANHRAELRRGQAEDLIGFMLTDLRDRLEPLGKLAILDGVGERALRYFAAVPVGELSDGEIERRAQALYQIGDVRLRRGDRRGALPPLTQSLALAQALSRRRPDDPRRLFALGQSHFWVGRAFWEKGDLAAARPHFLAYLDLCRRLVDQQPADPAYRLELSYAFSNLGSVERQQGNLEAALARFTETLVVQQELAARRPNDRDGQFELAATHDLLSATLMEMGRLDEAWPHSQAQLRILTALVDKEPDDFELRQFLGTSHDSLASWYEARGLVAPALEHARAAGAVFTALTAHDADNGLWRWQGELARLKEGHLLRLRGEPRAGDALVAAVAESAARQVKADAGDRKWRLLLARARVQLGMALAEGGRTAEAHAEATRAAERLTDLLRQQPNDVDAVRWLAQGLLLEGRLESRRGHAQAAAAAWQRAHQLLEPVARRSRQVEILEAWAALLLLEKQGAAARPVLERLAAASYRQPDFVALCRSAGVDFPTLASRSPS